MSVLARKRGLSSLEFYKNAIVLRHKITKLLLRDLGLKKTVRNIRLNTKEMEEADYITWNSINEKYGFARIPGDYPEWLIEKLRTSIWDITRDLMLNITRAYTVWATTRAEADLRRLSQDKAIADCESLLKELELAIDVLPVDAEKYMQYVEIIDKEIALLKGWRKSDNKRNKAFK